MSTKKDPNHVIRDEHDEVLLAKRVTMVGTQISIAVSADDNDSVQTQGRVFEYTPASDTPVDVTVCRDIIAYSSGSIEVFISPEVSGSNWISLGVFTDYSTILPILARRAKVVSTNPIILLGRG